MSRRSVKRTHKNVRALNSLYRDSIRQERRNIETRCPYCGKKMILGTEKDIHTYHQGRYLVCSNYPACDTYCRVDELFGKLELVSTPANRELRMMRKETHFWMQKLIDTQICRNLDNVYAMISPSLTIGNGKYIHVGQCREFTCKEICEACIKILYTNRERFEKFEGWRGGYKKSEATLEMVKEITR